MAVRNFVVKQMQYVKSEVDWDNDTTYYIAPNEEVFAICHVSGSDKLYIRSKINTGTEPKLFRELKYNDEYVYTTLNNVENEIKSKLGSLDFTLDTEGEDEVLQTISQTDGKIEASTVKLSKIAFSGKLSDLITDSDGDGDVSMGGGGA